MFVSKYAEALNRIRPGAVWSLERGDDYTTLRWDDTNQAKPTLQEYTAAVAAVEAEEANEATRDAAMVADVDRAAMVQQLRTATPAQIKAYINNNVTNLAEAKTMLARLALAVALLVRR